MLRTALVAVSFTLLSACSAGQVSMQQNSMDVEIGSNPPTGEYKNLGPISAKHGGGCGLFGAQGNFEGAMTILRNKAASRGADYVQIIKQEGEHMSGLCLDRAYIVDGFAFKSM
ncbi:hypothetical protein V6243_00820 [Cobetia marina]|uniref:Lipoprotein n=1 Tax=Cobetia marina TaxID=28258 RepID=A0ABU9GA57_COBMA